MSHLMRLLALMGACLVAGCANVDSVSGIDNEPASTTGSSSESDVPTGAESSATGEEVSSGNSEWCTDGIVNNTEECDLGTTAGHCNNCLVDRHVFVSSAFKNSSQLGGIDNADTICQELATAADLDNASMYRAWLSTTTEDARDHVGLHLDARYVLPNGEIVALRGEDFILSKLVSSIHQYESGENLTDPVNVWTGTAPNGTALSLNCLDWTADPSEKGYFGKSSATDSSWTLDAHFTNPAGCGSQKHLYCFELRLDD